MSVDEAIRFFENLDFDSVAEPVDPEALVARARAEGYDVSGEDLAQAAREAVSALRDDGELDDDRLESVAGGRRARARVYRAMSDVLQKYQGALKALAENLKG